MKNILKAAVISIVALGLSNVALAAQPVNMDELLEQVRQGRVKDAAENQQRIQEFQTDRSRQQQLLRNMQAEQTRQENLSAQLEDSFEVNDAAIMDLERALQDRLDIRGVQDLSLRTLTDQDDLVMRLIYQAVEHVAQHGPAARAVVDGRTFSDREQAQDQGDGAGAHRGHATPYGGAEIPAILLVSWVSYRLMPFVPGIDLQLLKDSLKPLLLQPQISVLDTFHDFSAWLAVFLLAATAAPGQRTDRWVMAAIPVIFSTRSGV